MRCIAANRSILTAIDQNTTLPDDDGQNSTAMTSDIDCMDTIQFADGWYSYPDLNTFESDLLLDVLTMRNIKPTKIISPWNIKAENSMAIPLTEIATRQLEALFNLSQLLFGLARGEQANYTFRDLQLGHPARAFREAGFRKFPMNKRSIDYFALFESLVNDIFKAGAIDIVLMMYKDPRLRCVKQKSLDFLTNVATISDIARVILDRHSQFLIQLLQGIRDGHLIEEKIPSLSLLLRLCQVIVEKNLLGCYQHLIDMQFIDILIDLFQNEQYKSQEYMIYFIKFESFALQCLQLILQSPEHVDMWSEKAQIRLVNYCCTLLYKSVLDHDEDDSHHQQQRSRSSTEVNHLMYAEEHRMIHSLSSGILTFLHVVRCRKEIGRFYRENEHFRELLSVMKHKYASLTSEYFSRDPSIADALNQVVNVMFDRNQRKKKRSTTTTHRIDDDNRNSHKCSNSLCQMTENNQRQFEVCPHCHQLSYCSQYCREVHWTLTHHRNCRMGKKENLVEDDSTVLCSNERFSAMLPMKTTSLIDHSAAFETLPIQISQARQERTMEITNDLCYPSSSSSSSSIGKKKSFKTLLSLLRVNGKRR